MGREAVLLWYEDGGDVEPRGFPTLLQLVGDGAIGVGIKLRHLLLLLEAAEVVEEGGTARGEGEIDEVIGDLLPPAMHDVIQEEPAGGARPEAVEAEDDVFVIPRPMARQNVLDYIDTKFIFIYRTTKTIIKKAFCS